MMKNKYAQLKELDVSVTKLGTKVAIIVGTISILIMGLGMRCTMAMDDKFFVVGIGIDLSYPLYEYITKKTKS